MSTNRVIKWHGPLVAAVLLALISRASVSQNDVTIKVGGNDLAPESVAPQTGEIMHGAGGVLGSDAKAKGFKLTSARYSVPEDGWPQFEHEGLTLKFGAPTPAVPLDDAERSQWRRDVVTFAFDKLEDRKPLYIYYLWSPDAKNAKAREILEAVLDVVGEAGYLATAIGVEYDISGKELPIGASLYERVAVPIKWDEASLEFIKMEHDPATIAGVVNATTTALPKGAYANFGAVENWSASAKEVAKKMGQLPPGSLSPMVATTYFNTVSKGPLIWPELTPVATFLAVDRELDIEGLKAEAILTSKQAWGAMLE